MDIFCLSCGERLDESGLDVNGIVHCECGERFVPQGQQLTYVDEIPHEEYLGG